jgi:predicted transcriptional regulator
LQTIPDNDPERIRITLALLDSIERDSGQSHRRLASELGIALGLTNAYMKRCVKKGFLKVRKAKPRNYTYYLTPRGFAEKTRLTGEYLSYSFSFFRQARSVCDAALELFKRRGVTRNVLAGLSDLAEIANICALESGIRVVAVVAPITAPRHLAGLPVVSGYDQVDGGFEGVLVTDLINTQAVLQDAVSRFGSERVVAPSLLGAYRRSVEGQQKREQAR